MKKTFLLKEQILTALFAAIYVALTLLIAPISYGMIQFRVSEVFNHLLVYNKKFIIALGLGVGLSNLWSPFFLLDIIIGTGATLLCSFISIVAFQHIQNQQLKFLFNTLNFSIIGMIPITFMIIITGDPNTFWVIYLPLVINELIILSLGQLALTLLNRKVNLASYLNADA